MPEDGARTGRISLRRNNWMSVASIGTVAVSLFVLGVFLLLVLAAAAYSVMNTLGNLLSLRCMNMMDASVQFPLLSATVTVLTALFGALFFREKLRIPTWVSLGLTVAGAALVAASPWLDLTLG